MQESVENEYAKIWITNNVIYIFYKRNGVINLNIAKEIVAMRLKFQNGKSYNGIAFSSALITFTPDARKYLETAGYDGIHKAAIVSSAKLPILVGNIFLFLKAPLKPTKLFSNERDALKWFNENNFQIFFALHK